MCPTQGQRTRQQATTTAVLSAEGKGLGGSNPLLHTVPRIQDLLAHPSEVRDCLPALSLVASHSLVPQRYSPVGLPALLSFTEVPAARVSSLSPLKMLLWQSLPLVCLHLLVLSQGVHPPRPPDPDDSKNKMKTQGAMGEFIRNSPRGSAQRARGGVMESPRSGSHGTEQS